MISGLDAKSREFCGQDIRIQRTQHQNNIAHWTELIKSYVHQ